jgi:hypothetical protein
MKKPWPWPWWVDSTLEKVLFAEADVVIDKQLFPFGNVLKTHQHTRLLKPKVGFFRVSWR